MDRNAALNRRMLANPDAKAIADMDICVPSTRAFARCTRRVVATAVGEAPAALILLGPGRPATADRG
jgi:hypothetical protein